MTMLKPSRLLLKPRFTQPYTIRKRNFTRLPDGSGDDKYTEVKGVRMSIQPLDKANDELKSLDSGERVQDKAVFYSKVILNAGDMFFFDNSWFRVTKPNFRGPYGFSDGEGTRYDGPSAPDSKGFVVT